ncbi:hypothetical protein [Aquimarina sp. 2201CG5-10]|uniref:hypothetical protein n=1 Tax=Aquimarina callyspongiae TaxID=3098150 RepID=UPI002AB45A66|nr:hypothetical protein [Aquimarina sp. 2201CG5-10]MDY8134317.1 hypothetical protein [Aquimarina sp. 2201CG5-10]
MKEYLKKIVILTIVLTAGHITVSCDNNDDVLVVVISEERAAEIVATSLAYNTYGLASNVNHFSTEITNSLDCEEQGSNSGTLDFTSIYGNVTSAFEFTDHFSKVCDPLDMISYEVTALHDIDALYFASQQNVNAQFTVTGLEIGTINEFYSGLYQREGNWISKIFNDSFDITYTMQFNELNVDKNTSLIVSGTSTFILNVDYSETSESSNFSGTVTFLNENEARVDFTNGSSYLLNLETGEINLIQS